MRNRTFGPEPGLTYFETLLKRATELNSVIISAEHCHVVSLAGPLRLDSQSWLDVATRAITALGGFSTKEIGKGFVAAAPANFTITHTAASKAVALIIRVSGARNAFKQAAVLLTIAGTGMTSTKFALYAHSNEATALVLLTNDNGGVGAIAAPSGITVAWLVADHAEAAGSEYAVSSELVTMRDFTRRGSAQ